MPTSAPTQEMRQLAAAPALEAGRGEGMRQNSSFTRSYACSATGCAACLVGLRLTIDMLWLLVYCLPPD
jgi:hypothetical protein